MLSNFRLGWVAPVWLLLSCNPFPSGNTSIPSDGDLNQQVIRQLIKGLMGQVPIASLAPFEWDTVYIIRPLLHPAEVRALRGELGTWAEQHEESLRKNFRNTFLVFAQKGKVARTAALPGNSNFIVDWEEEEGYKKLARPEAVMTSQLSYLGRHRSWYLVTPQALAP